MKVLMKTLFCAARAVALSFVLAVCLFSCGHDDDGLGSGSTAQNKALVGTKWTSQNWDYDIDGDGEWAYYFDEVYTVYFYSETEAVTYYARKTVDSDDGNSHYRVACFFKYYYDGTTIRTETITEPFSGFLDEYTLQNGVLRSSGYNFTKGTMDSNDYSWLNTIKGTTGACRWYYDFTGGLTIAGNGNMGDYKSYSSTPWNNKYRVVNTVNILEGVTYIGSYSFASPNIYRVELPGKGLDKIGAHAFSRTCLETISLRGVKSVGDGAFSGCDYANINFGEEIEDIGDYACDGCKSASLRMTPNLRRVGFTAFGGCKINGWTNSEVLEYVGGAAFGDVNVKQLDLPAIKELGHLAFHNTKFERIHIGPNLKKVTGTPFYGVSSSGIVTIDAPTPISLQSDFIEESYVKNWNLVVPAGSELNYQTAPYWKNFSHITGGGSGSGDQGGSSSGSVSTIDAIPGIFDVKLVGRVGVDAQKGEVCFRVSKSPNFESGTCDVTSDVSVSGLSGSQYEQMLGSVSRPLEPNTIYYYRAEWKYDSGGSTTSKYGETKTFKTLKSKKPNNLTYTIGGKTFKMVYVPYAVGAGFYMMQTELPHYNDITITYDGELVTSVFCLDSDGDRVVLKSDWRTFIDKLRYHTGIEWRLPTPSEWMFAAKGGNNSNGAVYSGSDNISDVAWYSGNSNKQVHEVALKQPNELGLYDMSGNFAELTYGKDLYDIDAAFYGGCWNDAASACTVASYKPGVTSGNIGKYKEKNAFDGRYITVRLVYPAE